MKPSEETELRWIISARTQETTKQAMVRVIEELSGTKYAGGGLFTDPSGVNLPFREVAKSIKELTARRRNAEREVWSTLAQKLLTLSEAISGVQRISDIYGLSGRIGKPLATLKHVIDQIRGVGLLWVEMVDQEYADLGETHEQKTKPEEVEPRPDRSVLD